MIVVEQYGMDDAILRISRFAQVDRNGLLAVLAERVRAQTLKRFQDKTAPDGTRWAPRKPATGRGRNHSRGGSLLVDTGRLRNSISSKIHGSTAEIGTNVFYAKFHQRGTRKMVARPFMGLNQQNISELTQIAEAFIGSATRF